MFTWNEDMIRFLQDASEQSDYHRLLAKYLAERLPQNAHVCDAGCGLGYLSLRLAPYCRQVTAADISPEALAVLHENCIKEGITNIETRCGAIDAMAPDPPYDAMIFCFFGTGDEALRIAKKQCRGPVIIIKKAWSEHRFSIGKQKLSHEGYEDAMALLENLHIPHRGETLEMEMGQPFRSVADACRFFEIYDKSGAAVTEEAVKVRLTSTGNETFPWYLPQPKIMGIITLDSRDIPEL